MQAPASSAKSARRPWLAAVACLGLIVAACSGSAATPAPADTVAAATATATPTATASPSPSPSDTPAPTPSPTATPTAKPTPKPTPVNPLSIGLCRAVQLKLVITSWQNDGTTSYAHVTAQNVSSASCNMRGTSDAVIIDGHGKAIASAGTSAAKVTTSDPTYTLNPGDGTNTIITWGNWCHSAPVQKVTVGMIEPFGLGSMVAKALGNAPIPTCIASGQPTYVSSEAWLP
jgi:hypothetical protein